jgi:CheY-like chemotaxis protein
MKKVILLIDDDTEDQEVFISQLREYDPAINVVSAFTGKQGIDLLLKTKPHMVFLDINLPGMNGIDVLKKIKTNNVLQNIPVFMYSTSDGFNSKPEALKLGAAKYFRKPHTVTGFMKIFKDAFSTV